LQGGPTTSHSQVRNKMRKTGKSPFEKIKQRLQDQKVVPLKEKRRVNYSYESPTLKKPMQFFQMGNGGNNGYVKKQGVGKQKGKKI